MNIKRILSLLLMLCMLLSLCACGNTSPEEDEHMPVTIELWLYPLGQWNDQVAVRELLKDFQSTYPYVTVNITCLPEENGSGIVSTSMESGDGPDILLGSLSQLQHAIRRGGIAVDMSDLWVSGTYGAVKDACTDGSGSLYALPLSMDILCMAINYEVFQYSGALQYIDETNHTWTTEGFINAIKAVRTTDMTPDTVALYCGGQGGDSGTRALVTNLYGGSFTDETHSRYTLDSEENIKALKKLLDLRSVIFDPDIVGEDENLLFSKQQLAMTLCWDSTQPQPEDFTAFPMAYPTEEGNASMPGEVWGFSLFDNGSSEQLDASKALLAYLTAEDSHYKAAVSYSDHYAVRSLSGVESDTYSEFCKRMGSYDLYTPGWTIARTEWYELLQRLSEGCDVEVEVETFCTNANAAAREQS